MSKQKRHRSTNERSLAASVRYADSRPEQQSDFNQFLEQTTFQMLQRHLRCCKDSPSDIVGDCVSPMHGLQRAVS